MERWIRRTKRTRPFAEQEREDHSIEKDRGLGLVLSKRDVSLFSHSFWSEKQSLEVAVQLCAGFFSGTGDEEEEESGVESSPPSCSFCHLLSAFSVILPSLLGDALY